MDQFWILIGIIGGLASIIALYQAIRDQDDRKKAKRDKTIVAVAFVVAIAGFSIGIIRKKVPDDGIAVDLIAESGIEEIDDPEAARLELIRLVKRRKVTLSASDLIPIVDGKRGSWKPLELFYLIVGDARGTPGLLDFVVGPVDQATRENLLRQLKEDGELKKELVREFGLHNSRP